MICTPIVTVLFRSCRYVYKPFQCFRLAGIPGPKPRPITGNLGLLRQFGVSFHLLDSFRSGFTVNVKWSCDPRYDVNVHRERQ